MPKKITFESAISSSDLGQVSRLLTENSKKSRFTAEERKQLEAHRNTLKKPRGKKSAAPPPSDSAAPSAAPPPDSAAPSDSAASAAPSDSAASAAPSASKPVSSRATKQLEKFTNVQSRFNATGAYKGKSRKGNATKLRALLGLKTTPFNADAKSKAEKMLADLEAPTPALPAVPEGSESNESSGKRFYNPTTGAPLEEEEFFNVLKETGLCVQAKKRSRTKKAKNKKALLSKEINKAKGKFANEYYSRPGPIGASLESQSASS